MGKHVSCHKLCGPFFFTLFLFSPIARTPSTCNRPWIFEFAHIKMQKLPIFFSNWKIFDGNLAGIIKIMETMAASGDHSNKLYIYIDFGAR